ncbi:hypothetical protein BH20ACT11_BH20ACT11_14930 [soil metagenome]|jgi:hypothetical protein
MRLLDGLMGNAPEIEPERIEKAYILIWDLS